MHNRRTATRTIIPEQREKRLRAVPFARCPHLAFTPPGRQTGAPAHADLCAEKHHSLPTWIKQATRN